MTYVSSDKETTDTATASVDVTFKAIRGDFSSLEVQGGTMSVSDTETGQCQGSSTFAGVIPPRGIEDRITPTTGEGIGTLVLNDGNDGVSTGPGEVRQSISFLIQLSLGFNHNCLGVLTHTGGTTVSSCLGDRSTSTTFILTKTGPGAFAGTCHDDIREETASGTLDWSGQAQQISP